MVGFKRGFYIYYKKLEMKPEFDFGQYSFPQPQPFSQSQQPGVEQKQVQKTTHAITPTSQEKPKKQMKPTLHQKVSEFNPSSQMSMEQLIKVVLYLKEEVRKLKKDNDKLMENLNKQEEIKSRFMSQERDLNVFQSISQDQSNQSQSQQQRQTEIGNRTEKIEESQQKLQLKKEIRQHKIDPMLIEEEVIRKPQRKQQQIKIIKKCFGCGSLLRFYRKCKKFQNKKLNYWIQEKKESRRSKKKQDQTECFAVQVEEYIKSRKI